jgi:hypothetical protein
MPEHTVTDGTENKLPAQAVKLLQSMMLPDEQLIWSGQPARIKKAPIIIMIVCALIVLLMQVPLILDDPESLLIVLGSFGVVIAIAAVSLFFIVRAQFRNTWYFVTTNRAIAYIPMLVIWGNAFQYLIGPNSSIELNERNEVGDIVIRSPDFYKNTHKPGRFLRLSNVAAPRDVQYKIAWVIAAKRQADGTTAL